MRYGLIAICAAMVLSGPALAGKGGRWRGYYSWGEQDRKFKFRTADGCEVERKWKKGEYEEKVKCKPGRYGNGY